MFTTVGVVGNSNRPTLVNEQGLFVPKYEYWLRQAGMASLNRGDFVALKPPLGTPNATATIPLINLPFRAFFIKRVIAVPGDEVSVREGIVYLNGKALQENYISSDIKRDTDSYPILCYEHSKLTSISTQMGRFDVEDLPEYMRDTQRMLVAPKTLAKNEDGESCGVGSLKLEPGYYFVMGDNREFGGSLDSRSFGPIYQKAIAGRGIAVFTNDLVSKVTRLETPAAFQ